MTPPVTFVLQSLIALAGGAMVTLSFAPYNFWFAGILGPAILLRLLQTPPNKHYFKHAWFFGFGLYAAGTSWVYVAIHDFGYTGAVLAFFMTVIFAAGLALVFALPFWLYTFIPDSHKWKSVFLFPAIWVLGEWIRSWFLTGFPWLYSGYAHIDTWLSGWGPVLGVFGLSYFTLLSSSILVSLFNEPIKLKKISHILVLFAIWLSGFFLQSIQWESKAPTEEISVALIQPNIDLNMKWDPQYRPHILEILRNETEKHWDKDLIVWPEAAIPMMYHEASHFLLEMDKLALQSNTSLITGILYDDYEQQKFFNSIIGIGEGKGIYFKQRLVPFGEYVPLESYLRGIIAFFDLPNSVIHAGPKNQQGLSSNDYGIAPFICYEIVYPDLVAKNLGQASVIVTISNDAWFGQSIGPKQHFQMAQMRALENNRYVIRATNTGISGIIDNKGRIVAQDTPYTQSSMSAKIQKIKGSTPFSLWGSLPIVFFCLLCVSFTVILALYSRSKTNE